MNVVELLNVTKRFGDVLALDNVTLKLKEGVIVGLLGPNGAGKTTTVKLITGLLRPTEGKVLLFGREDRDRKQIGYVPDEPIFYERMSAFEFLKFIAALYKVEDSNYKIEKFLKILDLYYVKDELISDYSYGMRHRLSYCCAFIAEPRLLIIDEPAAGLDPIIIKTIKDILKDWRLQGKTVFLSTHILPIAQELCDEVAFINKGRIILHERVDSLLSGSETLEEVFLRILR